MTKALLSASKDYDNGYMLLRCTTLRMTSSITIRLSEEELREIRKYGRISDVVREALHLYIRSESSRRVIQRLRELQASSKVRTTIEEDLRLIHEDRLR